MNFLWMFGLGALMSHFLIIGDYVYLILPSGNIGLLILLYDNRKDH